MSHGITDGDIKQGRAHRAGDTKAARTRSSEPQKDGDLDLKFSIARSRAASMGSCMNLGVRHTNSSVG